VFASACSAIEAATLFVGDPAADAAAAPVELPAVGTPKDAPTPSAPNASIPTMAMAKIPRPGIRIATPRNAEWFKNLPSIIRPPSLDGHRFRARVPPARNVENCAYLTAVPGIGNSTGPGAPGVLVVRAAKPGGPYTYSAVAPGPSVPNASNRKVCLMTFPIGKKGIQISTSDRPIFTRKYPMGTARISVAIASSSIV